MKHLLSNNKQTGLRVLLFSAAVALIAALTLLNGCGIEKTDNRKISDLNYELVEEENTPEELKKKIEEKKAADFKLTYESDNYLYIVRGYGEGKSGQKCDISVNLFKACLKIKPQFSDTPREALNLKCPDAAPHLRRQRI